MFPTFEQFEKYMSKVVEYDNAVTEVWNILNENVIDKLSCAQSSLIDLLEELMGDSETSWISYWLYELNQGKDYTEGSVTIDGVNVTLATLEDLYKILLDNRSRTE